MSLVTVIGLLTLGVGSLIATQHTGCYNYFLQKDHCVFSAAGEARCHAPKKECSGIAVTFQLGPSHSKRSMAHVIQPRYTTNNKSFFVAGGVGICGKYDSYKQDGVCLWSGNGSPISDSGWLNDAKTSNCGKKVYIQRKGRPGLTVYAPVVDGCGFNMIESSKGCFEIAFTATTFQKLKPTEEESKQGGMFDVHWDFDNLDGSHTRNGPV
ncbi:hypothetical protein O181_085881 [Austropuccinia psidii MF-1]|uniref:Secreted protein n=1 Tax=Austropuccinia psidii MF-1 TaxID=1389203 RepID=A0A9Q3FTT7_9BASI|nr:hypothetical protein [Austropuccinia psidii MF-1]